MPLFTWDALTSTDEPRSGELVGADEVQVIELLRRQGLRVTRVRRRSLRAMPRPAVGVAPADLVAALRTFMALRTAGVGAAEALDLTASRSRGPLARTLHAVQLAALSGVGLGEAFARHPHTFGALGARALADADARGVLDITLASLVDLLARAARVRRELRAIAARPLIAAAALLAWLALLAGALVPATAAAYARLGVELSGPPARLAAVAPYLSLGTSIVAALLALASAALAALAWGGSRGVAPPAGLGEALRRLALSRFARALATLLVAEVPRLHALELAAWEADDRRLTESVLRARGGLSQGGDLGGVLAGAALPQAFARAVQAAERSGDLPGLLRQLADLDEEEALAWLTLRSWRIVQVCIALSIGTAVLAALALALPLLGAR